METESLVGCLKLSFTFSLGSKNEGKGCVCVFAAKWSYKCCFCEFEGRILFVAHYVFWF